MHALPLILNLIDISLSLFHIFTATFLSYWENETFCLKCGLDVDQFISLVGMWTRSTIANIYGSTVNENIGHSFINIMVTLSDLDINIVSPFSISATSGAS